MSCGSCKILDTPKFMNRSKPSIRMEEGDNLFYIGWEEYPTINDALDSDTFNVCTGKVIFCLREGMCHKFDVLINRPDLDIQIMSELFCCSNERLELCNTKCDDNYSVVTTGNYGSAMKALSGYTFINGRHGDVAQTSSSLYPDSTYSVTSTGSYDFEFNKCSRHEGMSVLRIRSNGEGDVDLSGAISEYIEERYDPDYLKGAVLLRLYDASENTYHLLPVAGTEGECIYIPRKIECGCFTIDLDDYVPGEGDTVSFLPQSSLYVSSGFATKIQSKSFNMMGVRVTEQKVADECFDVQNTRLILSGCESCMFSYNDLQNVSLLSEFIDFREPAQNTYFNTVHSHTGDLHSILRFQVGPSTTYNGTSGTSLFVAHASINNANSFKGDNHNIQIKHVSAYNVPGINNLTLFSDMSHCDIAVGYGLLREYNVLFANFNGTVSQLPIRLNEVEVLESCNVRALNNGLTVACVNIDVYNTAPPATNILNAPATLLPVSVSLREYNVEQCGNPNIDEFSIQSVGLPLQFLPPIVNGGLFHQPPPTDISQSQVVVNIESFSSGPPMMLRTNKPSYSDVLRLKKQRILTDIIRSKK